MKSTREKFQLLESISCDVFDFEWDNELHTITSTTPRYPHFHSQNKASICDPHARKIQ